MAARDGREVVVAHLDRDGAAQQPLARQPARHRRAPSRRSRCGSRRGRSDLSRRCSRCRDDFASRFGTTGRSSMPFGELAQPVGVAADRVPQQLRRRRAHVDQPLDAALAQPLRGHRPDAPQRIDRQLLQEPLDALAARSRSGRPASSSRTRSSRGTCSARRRPTRSGRCVRWIAAFSRRATSRAERLAPGVLGDVEIRLVERQRLDQRRHRAEDREHRLRRALYFAKSGRTMTGAGTAAPRAPSASPSARRSAAPRSSPRRRRRVRSGSPPTATGLPRSAGLSRCSTDA